MRFEEEVKWELRFITVAAILTMVIGLFLFKSSVTGFAVLDSVSEKIDLDFSSNTSYLFDPHQDGYLNSLKFSGYFEGDSYKILIGNKTVSSYGYDNDKIENIKLADGSGELNLEFSYGNNDGYDNNNDGTTHITSVIDFSLDFNSNLELNYSKLCTKYKINNLDDNTSNYICNGYNDCCSFLGLSQSSESWNDSIYLNYGKYGSGYNNTLDAQIVYYDVSFDPEDLHSNIYSSDIRQLGAYFYDLVSFIDACSDSCELPMLMQDSYELNVFVDGVLHVSNFTYSIDEEIKTQTDSVNITSSTIKQYSAVIGKPVKWEKKVKVEIDEDKFVSNMTISLPEIAGNVSVTKIDAETGIKKEVDASVENEKQIEEVEPITVLTGNAVKNGLFSIITSELDSFVNGFARITGLAVLDEQENVSVSVSEQLTDKDELVVEYYTEAPYAEEIIVNDNQKEITVIGPDSVHYTDVLAYSSLPSEVSDLSKVKLYWDVNGTRTNVDFDAYDSDGNELYDYIEWVVPHLSNQSYEIIIEITKASLLDSNRTFVSDIYDYVKAKDNNYTTVQAGEYVRVTFEQNLSSVNDITIYARSNESSIIEIYTENSDYLINSFENISNESYYKVYLTSLNGSFDTFDLKVLNNPVEFDYIVDPSLNETYINSTTTSTKNRTEMSNLGARLSAPVLFMDFNSPLEGTYVQDNSLYNNYGTTSGSPAYNTTCDSPAGGNCYTFDGSDDRVSTANNFPLSGNHDISYSLWFNTNVADTQQMIASYGPGGDRTSIFLYTSSDNYLATGIGYIGATQSQATLSTSTWYFATITYHLTNLSLYLNGIHQGSLVVDSLNVPSHVFDIGAIDDSGYTQFFNGAIDSVQVWDRVLSASEILCLYNGTGCNGVNNSNYIGKYASDGNFKGLVYYNSTATYWNVSLDLADTYNAATGIVNNKNQINLSDPNLVSYWDLDSGGTDSNPYNDEKGSNDGTPTGTNNATGISSGAIRFDGSDDYISMPTLGIAGDTPRTFSFWLKPAVASIPYLLYSSVAGSVGANWEIYVSDNNGIAIDVGSDYTITSSNIITANEWQHVAVVYHGGNIENTTVYVDRIPYPCIVSGWRIPNTSDVAPTIGQGHDWLNFYNGAMDEFLVYNSSLSASEVEALYKAGLSQHANTNVTIQTRTANNYNTSDEKILSVLPMGEKTDLIGLRTWDFIGAGTPPAVSNISVVGQSYYFDGSNGLFNTSNMIRGYDYTASAWVYATEEAEQFHGIFANWDYCCDIHGESFYLNFRDYEPPRFSYEEGSPTTGCSGTTGIMLNRWYYVTLVRDRDTDIKIYVNGALDSTCSAETKTQTQGGHSFVIGCQQGFTAGANSFWRGYIDDFRIYNRTLSATEIQNLYELGSYHISDWSAWSPARTVSSGSDTQTVASAKFMQYKLNLYTNDTTVSPYVISHSGLLTQSDSMNYYLPNTTSVILNSTNTLTNDSNQNLTCYATITDTDNSNVYANYSWYKNGALQTSLSGRSSAITQGTLSLVSTLGAGNTTYNDTWICSVKAYDGFEYETDWNNATALVIRNTVPSVSAVSLTTTNTTLNDTTVNLTGSVTASDVDADNITYAYNWYKNNTLNATTLITSGLVAYYPLNNDTLDYYGSNDGVNNGAVQNKTSYAVGGSYAFDGVNDYINLPYSTNLYTAQKTISVWIKRNQIDHEMIINGQWPSSGRSWHLVSGWYTSTSNVAFGASITGGDSDCTSATGGISNTGQWYHIAATYNGSTLNMYINGNLTGTGTCNPTGGIYAGTSDVWIGKATSGLSQGDNWDFNGDIDEVMIFNRSLTASEIQQLYWAGVAGGHTMNASQLRVGDVWKVGVKAADYLGWSGETNSSNVTILDKTPPYFTLIPANATLNYSSNSLGVQFTAADNIAVLNYSINDTTRFSINNSGYLRNITKTAIGVYVINVSVNDTSGNYNSTLYQVTVQNNVPAISSVVLNSTNILLNDTTVNLTGYVTASDTNGDNITYAYSWYKNNVLNATTLITDGLVAYYPLNNDTLDYYRTNDGTNNGATLNTSGKIGGAYGFDGDDYINLGSSSNLNPPVMTIALWVKRGVVNDAQRIINRWWDGANRAYYLFIGTSDNWIGNGNVVWFGVSMDGSDSNANYAHGGNLSNPGQWYFVAATYNASTSKIYVDGINVANDSSHSGNIQSNSDDTTIGVDYNYNDYFDGTIDEVMIFNRSLSASEIQQLYLAGNWSGHTMHSSRLTTGDNWKLGVKAADSAAWSNEVNSSNVTIRDTISPVFNVIPANATLEYGIDSLNVYFNATDNTAVSSYSVNNTNFSINSSGWLSNATKLGIGTYSLNISVNDSSGNYNSTLYSVLVNDTIKPTISGISITPLTGSAGTVFNISVNLSEQSSISSVIAYIQKPDENITATVVLSNISNTYNGSWNSSGAAQGLYVVDIFANDSLGNNNEYENQKSFAVSSSATGVYTNSSVIYIQNVLTSVNAQSQTNTTLDITTLNNINGSVSIGLYSSNIESSLPSGVTGLGKYVEVIVDNTTNNNISVATIKVYYTDAEVTAANLQESSLRLYKFNETSQLWYLLSPGGVDTTNNYVWANVTSFSSFGVFGTTSSSGSTGGSSGGGGGGGGSGAQNGVVLPEWTCSPDWRCSDWSDCKPDSTMTRSCSRADSCEGSYERPTELMHCVYNPSCSDGIKNGNEKGVDCGGSCSACETNEEKEAYSPGSPEVSAQFSIKSEDQAEIKYSLLNYAAEDLDKFEIELNINNGKSTKVLDFIDEIDHDKEAISRKYDIKNMIGNDYEIVIKLYKEGKKIEESRQIVRFNKDQYIVIS